jgi:predicted DNA-binding transcriptional regulator AlpA
MSSFTRSRDRVRRESLAKTRPTAEFEAQVKHHSRPVDERVAAALAPPLLGYSIQEFCTAVGISLSFFYELKQARLAPRAMKLGTRRIISVEEAQNWCRERTEASGKVGRLTGSIRAE